MKSEIPYFDAHADTLSKCADFNQKLQENAMPIDLVRAAKFSSYAQFFSIFTDAGGKDDARGEYERLYTYAAMQIAANADKIALCTNARQIREAGERGLRCAPLSVEGAELLGCCEQRLASAYQDGVRAVNLTWNYDNSLAGSCATGTNRGLTPKGRSFFAKAQRLGIIVDMSHCSERAFWDAAQIAVKPIMASHSNSFSVYPHERNLTDEQFRFLISNRAVAGINLYSGFVAKSPGISDLVRHIEHFMSLGGEKMVAHGGDLDGCERPPESINGIEDIP